MNKERECMINLTNLSKRECEIVVHYKRYLGIPTEILSCSWEPNVLSSPIHVLKYPPVDDDHDWVYITIGMSNHPIPHSAENQCRIELMMYSMNEVNELAASLMQLSVYPFINAVSFGIGDTIAGEIDVGVVKDSPLTEFLLTPVYFEDKGFDYFTLSDNSHIRILWATPIYLEERLFVKSKGWRTLVEQIFPDKTVYPADLWRPNTITELTS